MDINDLIARADEYKMAAGIVDDSTVSYRVFGGRVANVVEIAEQRAPGM